MKSTYELEGDGVLVFIVYKEVSKLRAVISTVYYHDVNAVAKKVVWWQAHLAAAATD